jgi:hypothetical protein
MDVSRPRVASPCVALCPRICRASGWCCLAHPHAGPHLLAMALDAKFANHLPYRTVRARPARVKVSITEPTISRYALRQASQDGETRRSARPAPVRGPGHRGVTRRSGFADPPLLWRGRHPGRACRQRGNWCPGLFRIGVPGATKLRTGKSCHTVTDSALALPPDRRHGAQSPRPRQGREEAW